MGFGFLSGLELDLCQGLGTIRPIIQGMGVDQGFHEMPTSVR